MRIFQPDREFLDAFISKNATLCSGTVLDVGGGDGKRYRQHFAHVDKFMSLDPDPSVSPDIVAGAEKIPLEDASVDAILCSEVLMYIHDIQKAIDEMARVLKPGAPLILTTSFMATPAIHEQYHWQPGYAGLSALLEKNFSDISIQPRGHYHAQMSQNRRRYLIEKYNLYNNKILGKLFSLFSKPFGAWALWRDRRDTSKGNLAFTMGYNTIAKKR